LTAKFGPETIKYPPWQEPLATLNPTQAQHLLFSSRKFMLFVKDATMSIYTGFGLMEQFGKEMKGYIFNNRVEFMS